MPVTPTLYEVEAYVCKNVLPDKLLIDIVTFGVVQLIVQLAVVPYVDGVPLSVTSKATVAAALPPVIVVLFERMKASASVENVCVQSTPPAGVALLDPAVKFANTDTVPAVCVRETTSEIYELVKSEGLSTVTEKPVAATSQFNDDVGKPAALNAGVKDAKFNTS